LASGGIYTSRVGRQNGERVLSFIFGGGIQGLQIGIIFGKQLYVWGLRIWNEDLFGNKEPRKLERESIE